MRYRLVVAAMGISGALVGAAALPAEAAVIRTYRDVATGLCLDSNSAAQVYTKSCNGGNFQKWNVAGADASTVLRNVATGLCLDSNTARQAYTHSCNGGNFQKWSVTRYGDGATVRFRNVATGLCLDSDSSGRAYTLACNTGNFQKWRR